ncbi:hypothetical protein DV738_g962, partial [Chaetothyriales sp. CBS 135597]
MGSRPTSSGSDNHSGAEKNVDPETTVVALSSHSNEPEFLQAADQDDTRNPQNWSPWKKRLVFLALMSSSLLADGGMVWGATLIVPQAIEWKTSIPHSATSLNYGILLQGFGGIFAVPLIDAYGRLPIWLWPQVITLFVVVGCIYAQSFSVFTALRTLQGLFGTVPQVIGLPIIHDMYAPRDWPRYINTWGTTFLVGPFLFPAIAGYVLAGTGSWRDSFSVLAGFYGLSTILILLFGHETFYNKATGTQQTNRVKAFMGIGNTELPKGRTLTSSTLNIIKLIFTPPLLLVGISTMVNFTWPIGITTTIDSFVRAPPYLFDDIEDASIRFAGVIGALLGFVFGYFFNEWIYSGSGGRRKAHWRTEYRLHGVWIPIGFMVCGLLTYGLTLNYGKSWVGLAFGWIMVNIGMVGSTVAITAYALEKYPDQSTVVSAIINMWRTCGGFSVGYFQPSWIAKNGVAAVFATQAGVVATWASGHNRWSKIRHDKGANDKIKSREHGGADPSLNSKLAIAIANAKRGQLSKSSIESAIAKGQGKSLSGAPLENVTVEAMLPHGVAAIIEYQTESKAKVLQDIRALINKKGGSITPTAYIVDDVLEEAIEAGATDVTSEDDGQVVVETEPADVVAVSERLQERLKAQVERVEIIMEAKEDAMVELDSNQAADLEGLIELIEDEPSLQNVLQSWQEAFEKHPIVETRSIEKQLRLSIANDRGRLRNLVGDNYRELLGTADRIVLVEKQTREVEGQIYEIGRQCQPPLPQRGPGKEHARRQVIAQLRLLQRSVSEARIAFRQKEWLLCSRLIAIAGLLAKSLGDESIPAVRLLQRKAASLRQALLISVDAKLANPLSEPQTLVEACCAYCFVTSASSSDVLTHLQRLRLEKLRKVLGSDRASHRTIVDALRYLLESLQVIKNLAGRSLLEALGSWQKHPIWESEGLQSLELLDLKSLVPLLPEEIRSFIPLFKRKPLAPRDVHQILEGWSHEARTLWLSSLEKQMLSTESYVDLLQFRQSLCGTFLPLYFSTPGGGDLFQAIRKAVESRMHTLAKNRCLSLSHIISRFEGSLRVPEAAQSLWQPELAKLSLNDGGQTLLQQVWGRYTGRSASQTKALRRITRWISSVQDMQAEFGKLRNSRWREHLEEADDDQEDEAQEILDTLTQTDPASYAGQLQEALLSALTAYEEKMSGAVDKLGLQGEDHTLEAVSLLRVIRDSLNLLQRAFRDHHFDQVRGKLPNLYGIVASGVVARLEQWEKTGAASATTIPPAASSLDDVPSPRTFAFLRQLCTVMLDIGNTDIWAPFIETTFDEAYVRTALGQPLQSVEGSQRKAAEAYWARTRLLFGLLAGPQS